jgi:hypothetical protein
MEDSMSAKRLITRAILAAAAASRFPRALLLALALALSAVIGVAFSSAASAAPTAVKVSATPSSATPYCTGELTPGSTVVKNAQCYSTHSAMAAAIPATQTVISIDYADANYGGLSFTWTASITTCTYFPEFANPTMPSGWNDTVSSYADYANCNNNPHYENVNYGGSVANCGPNCSYIGAAMNDRTSSEKWGK